MSAFIILAATGLVVNIGLVLLAAVLADRHRRRHLARLQRAATGTARPALVVVKPRNRPTPEDAGPLQRAVALLERLLDQSTLRLTVQEIILHSMIVVLGLYAVSVLLLGLSPLGALVATLVVYAAVFALVLRIARARYRAAFVAQLPEALDILARGLRAGRPITDSLAVVLDNISGPVQREFARCHNEIRMGHSLPDSFERLSQRLPLPEIVFFSVATTLQAETGGNLIETLESLASQLRERRKLRKKAHALSSEARASAVILAGLPFAVAVALALLNAGYLEPLYADPRGQIMSLVALCSIGLGIYVMIRMGKLNV